MRIFPIYNKVISQRWWDSSTQLITFCRGARVKFLWGEEGLIVRVSRDRLFPIVDESEGSATSEGISGWIGEYHRKKTFMCLLWVEILVGRAWSSQFEHHKLRT